MVEIKKINKSNVIWWVNHLCNDYAQYARNKGYSKQADEVEEVRDILIAAVKEYRKKEGND